LQLLDNSREVGKKTKHCYNEDNENQQIQENTTHRKPEEREKKEHHEDRPTGK
jgi:hypothetical protein